MEPGENPPIGIILCSEKSDERVELLQLEQSGLEFPSLLRNFHQKKYLKEDYTKQ